MYFRRRFACGHGCIAAGGPSGYAGLSIMGITDTTDSPQLTPAVRSVPWKDVRKQGGILMMDVNTAAMITRATTATAPV